MNSGIWALRLNTLRNIVPVERPQKVCTPPRDSSAVTTPTKFSVAEGAAFMWLVKTFGWPNVLIGAAILAGILTLYVIWQEWRITRVVEH